MQIHELNTKALTDPAYIAFDDGTDTYKADFNQVIDDAVAEAFTSADVSGGVVNYTSGDAASPTAWTDVSVISSGSTLATLMNRISTMVKNVRYLKGLTDTLNGKTTQALKVVQYTREYTISANSNLNISADDFGASDPSGYNPVAITHFSSGNENVYVRTVNALAQAQYQMMSLKNTTGSAISTTAYIRILYAKSSLL